MAYNDPNIERGHFGIRNNGTGYSSVICPITPSADDTNDPKGRRLTSTVHYRAGGPFGSDPPPTCQFFTRNRGPGLPAGEELWSSAFDHANFDDKFVRRIGFDIGSDRNDIALGVFCELGPGVTLQGITTSMSVAPVSAGF